MNDGVFAGAALLFVSAFHLVPALLVGEIPARGRCAPLTREERPRLFAFALSVFAIAGVAGLILLGCAAAGLF